MEFHWGHSNGSAGSEHSVNGRRFPVEVRETGVPGIPVWEAVCLPQSFCRLNGHPLRSSRGNPVWRTQQRAPTGFFFSREKRCKAPTGALTFSSLGMFHALWHSLSSQSASPTLFSMKVAFYVMARRLCCHSLVHEKDGDVERILTIFSEG